MYRQNDGLLQYIHAHWNTCTIRTYYNFIFRTRISIFKVINKYFLFRQSKCPLQNKFFIEIVFKTVEEYFDMCQKTVPTSS